MKSTLRRIALVVALAASFAVGRASSRHTPDDPSATATVPADATVVSSGPASHPWAVQGFRGAECQVLGDIPECD
jgi:hypothetical protein